MAGKPKKIAELDKTKDKPKGRSKSPSRKPTTTTSATSISKSKNVSPERTKAASPSRKSPARKSPARKSPARNKSPSRKSPSRAAKSVEKTVDKPKTSEKVVKRGSKLFETDTDSDTQEPVQEVKEKPKATVRGRSRKADSDLDIDYKYEDRNRFLSDNTFGLSKRLTRYSQTQDVERVVHLKHFDTVTAKLGEFSDEDDIAELKKSESLEQAGNKYGTEFGGTLGTLFFTISLPLTLIGTFIVCNENTCSFTQLPNLKKFTNVWTYFDLISILGFTAYSVITALLFAAPFGGRKVTGLLSKQEKWTYTINGLFSLLILVVILISLEARSVPITDYIVNHIFHLGVASILVGTVIAVTTYVASFYGPISALNVHVSGKGRIYSFFMGRQVNPRLFNAVDLKMFSLKHCIITTILLDAVYFYKSLDLPNIKTVSAQSGVAAAQTFDWKLLSLHPTLILLVVLHLIYLFDSLIHEAVWLTSFEIQYEGYGYMSAVGYMIYPFLLLSGTKYIADYNINLATWQLCVIVAVFLLGYVFFRGANNQKDAFRKNPYSPALSHLETIPTMQGKKLLVSGFWGIVRHPNYLGDILMMSSFAAFIWCVPPVIILYASILLLVHRAHRDNARCKEKYGAAWDRYCQRVKNVLIPKVY